MFLYYINENTLIFSFSAHTVRKQYTKLVLILYKMRFLSVNFKGKSFDTYLYIYHNLPQIYSTISIQK